MATVQRFEDLKIWKMARAFCSDVFRITHYEQFSKDYRFRDQIRASSGSIMDNIAEGFERDGNKEFCQFLAIAKGSCGESRSQLHRSFDYKYIENEEYEVLCQKTTDISKAISSLINYLKQSELTGIKYK
jgi:four helix bundle protein